MKRLISPLAIFILLILCAACATTPETPSPTEPSQSTSTSQISALEPTATPTSTPAVTPYPTLAASPPIFVREGTPPIQPQEPITVDNAYRIRELARWGYGAINEVAHSKDGQLMYVHTSMGVYAYKAGTLDEVWRYEVDAGASAFDDSEQYLAVGTYSGEIILLDAVEGSETHRWGAHADEVLDVEFSSDETSLGSGSYDKTLKLWQLESKPLASLKFEKKFDDPVYYVLVIGDGELIYYRYEVIDTNSGEVVYLLPEDYNLVSVDQNIYIASGEIRRLSDNKLLTKVIYEDIKTSFQPFGRYVLSNTGDILAIGDYREDLGITFVSIWSVTSGKLVALFQIESMFAYSVGHLAKPAKRSGPGPEIIRSLSFSQDDKYLVFTNGVGNVFILDLEKESVKQIIRFGFDRALFSPSGNHVISYNRDGIEISKRSTGKRVDGILIGWLANNFGIVPTLFFSPDSIYLGAGSHLWNLDIGERRYLPFGESILGFSENGRIVFSIQRQWWVTQRQTVDLTLLNQAQLEWTEEALGGSWYWNDFTWWEMNGWGISPDGSVIRAGAYETPYLSWNVNTGEFMWPVGGSSIHHSMYSKDGRYLVEESYCNVIVRERQPDGIYEQI